MLCFVPGIQGLVRTSFGPSYPRVVLTDYHVAIVRRYTLDERVGRGAGAGASLALPVNPMQWFWKQALGGDFIGWVPDDWEGSHKPMQEWLLQRFDSKEQRALYEPVTEELKVDEW